MCACSASLEGLGHAENIFDKVALQDIIIKHTATLGCMVGQVLIVVKEATWPCIHVLNIIHNIICNIIRQHMPLYDNVCQHTTLDVSMLHCMSAYDIWSQEKDETIVKTTIKRMTKKTTCLFCPLRKKHCACSAHC
jgi:hypothetical protein